MASISNGDLLRSRVEDLVFLCERRNTPMFLGFLDEAEQASALSVLRSYDSERFAFYGGFDEAERRIVGYFPSYMPPDEAAYPLVRLNFHFREGSGLSHRDFLGTILSIGLKRETIGDILCSDNYAVVFVRDEVARYITEQVTKVGGVGVKITVDETVPLPIAHTYSLIQDTIASPRLDVILKALLRCSRENAAQMIVSGLVSVDHVVVCEVSANVRPTSVISVRGKGRFIVDRIGPSTKKGRLYFNARKCV